MTPKFDSSEIQQTRAAWDELAAGYDAHVTPSHRWLGEEGLRRAELAAGMRFLDVAAGTGALSLPAAQRGAHVLAVDLSPRMLEHLKARAEAEGLTIETEVRDGHALALADESFDRAGSQFGVMLFPNMPQAVRELARVTKRGGRVLMTVYGPPSQIEFLCCFVTAIRAAVPEFPGIPENPAPLPFQLQDPARLREELENAGLRAVRVETIVERLTFTTGAQLWEWLTNSNPIPRLVLDELRLSNEQLADLRESLDQQVRERARGNKPAILTNPVHIGVGTK